MNASSTTSDGPRRTWFIVVGVAVFVVGLSSAIGLWIAAGQRLDDAVDGLARAPVGCDTVLDFDTGGTYVLFVETKGQLDETRGDCGATGDFEWSGDGGEVPEATLTLTDPDGNDVTLSSDDGITYDAGGSTGTSVQSVDIDNGGDHTLRVESADTDFAVSVGRDPNDGVAAVRLGAVAAGLVGALVGGGLVIVGLRRSPAAQVTDTPWTRDAAGAVDWPSSPPGFPAPPATTGATAAVGPPTAPPILVPTTPLPMPPGSSGPGSSGTSHWAPPPA